MNPPDEMDDGCTYVVGPAALDTTAKGPDGFMRIAGRSRLRNGGWATARCLDGAWNRLQREDAKGEKPSRRAGSAYRQTLWHPEHVGRYRLAPMPAGQQEDRFLRMT